MNDTLKSFIDNMFINLPKTEDLNKVKADLSDTMQEKYLAYKNEGKTENEAVGLVISEFGNIDELLAEYDLTAKVDVLNEITESDALEMIDTYKKYSFLIGIATLIIIVLAGSLYWIRDSLQATEARANLIAAVVFLGGVLPSITLYVFSGIQLSPYSKQLNDKYFISANTRNTMSGLQKKNRRSYALNITIGVSLCILSVLLITAGILTSYDVIRISGFVVLGIAVHLFIVSGNLAGVYNRLLSDTKKSEKNKKVERIVSIAASIVWPLVYGIYMISGLLWQTWGTLWVIFPIVGLLFGAFVAIISTIYSDK